MVGAVLQLVVLAIPTSLVLLRGVGKEIELKAELESPPLIVLVKRY
jgi:hypothetical protein